MDFIKKGLTSLNEINPFGGEDKVEKVSITEIQIPFGNGMCSWRCAASTPTINRQTSMFESFNGRDYHRDPTPRWEPILVDFKDELGGEDHDVKLHEWFRIGNYMDRKNITLIKYGSNGEKLSSWHLIGCLPTTVVYNNPEVSGGEEWKLSVNFTYNHGNLSL